MDFDGIKNVKLMEKGKLSVSKNSEEAKTRGIIKSADIARENAAYDF